MKQYKTLLFDMDGTVIDTDPLLKESFHILYDKYRDGHYTSEEEIWYFSGPPIKKTLAKEFPDLELDFIFKEFNKVSESLYPTHTLKYENSKGVLLELKKAGYQLGIVTNKVHRLALYALKCVDLDNIFDIVIGFEDVKNPKPDAEGILKAIDLFKSNQESTLYIGDNATDILSADNAKVDSCLVLWGPRKVDPNVKPTFKVNSYIDLKEKLMYGKGI